MEYYKIDGMTIQINLKSICNLDCDYCLLPKHVKSQKENDNEIIDNTVVLINNIKAENIDVKAFAVFGAEPFTVGYDIMGSVLNLMTEAFPNAFLKIQTNGTLCTPKYMEKFMKVFKYPERLLIGFSMDGVKDIHNKHRCDSWDLMVTNFVWIKSNTPINTNVICTTNIEHYDDGQYEQELVEFIETMEHKWNTKVTISYADLTIRNVGDTHIGETEFSAKFASFLIRNDYIKKCVKLFQPNYCYRKGNDCDKTLFDLNKGKTYQCEKEFSPDKEFIQWKDHKISEVMTVRHNRTKDYLISKECDTCEYQDWCNGGCPLKRDVNGLAKSCYVTKTVLTHVKENINPDWRAYLNKR